MMSRPARPVLTRRPGLSPRALLPFYAARFRIEIATTFAYRGAVLIWLLSLIVQPLVSLVVWTTVADSQGGAAGGYTASDYAAYFVAVMVVNQLTFMWHLSMLVHPDQAPTHHPRA